MQYTYCLANASLVLRLMTYLSKQIATDLASVTVIYLVDRWIVRIKLHRQLSAYRTEDFLAFLQENGYPFTLSAKEEDAISALDLGASLTKVTAQYQVVVVSHGGLHPESIESFRKMYTSGLGYCPPSLV